MEAVSHTTRANEKPFQSLKAVDPPILFVSDEFVCGVGLVADKEIKQQPTIK